MTKKITQRIAWIKKRNRNSFNVLKHLQGTFIYEKQLLKWAIPKLLEEFNNVNEHGFSESVQTNFSENVESVISVLEDVSNPFEDRSNDMIDQETWIVVPETVAQKINNNRR